MDGLSAPQPTIPAKPIKTAPTVVKGSLSAPQPTIFAGAIKKFGVKVTLSKKCLSNTGGHSFEEKATFSKQHNSEATWELTCVCVCVRERKRERERERERDYIFSVWICACLPINTAKKHMRQQLCSCICRMACDGCIWKGQVVCTCVCLCVCACMCMCMCMCMCVCVLHVREFTWNGLRRFVWIWHLFLRNINL